MTKSSIKEKYLIFKVKQNKDAEAYGQLYDFYVSRIYRFVYFKVRTKEEAEDITSEVFLKTWEYINKTNRKIDNLNALFYRVARNAVIDHYRSKQKEANIFDEDQLEMIKEKRDLAKDTEEKIDVENVQKHLLKLKEVYREVIILKYIEQFSVFEISEIIGKSKGNVRVLIHRALKALKEIIGE
jgi:RNA polymerase sigma-70 factor, ECF subfamily